MDTAEARDVARERLEALRKLTADELTSRYLDTPATEEFTAPSGKTYQVETQAFWDDRDRKNLRVMVSVDDGGWRSLVPISDAFIIAADGTFIGE